MVHQRSIYIYVRVALVKRKYSSGTQDDDGNMAITDLIHWKMIPLYLVAPLVVVSNNLSKDELQDTPLY